MHCVIWDLLESQKNNFKQNIVIKQKLLAVLLTAIDKLLFIEEKPGADLYLL